MAQINSTISSARSRSEVVVCSPLSRPDNHGRLPKGVYIQSDWARERPYMAQACYMSKKYCLGKFDNPDDAGKEYKKFRDNPEKWLKEHGKQV